MSSHIEVHILSTATDADRLAKAGFPNLSLEPHRCSACNAGVGEVLGAEDTVFWRPCGLVVDDRSLALLCRKCLKPLDDALGGVYR